MRIINITKRFGSLVVFNHVNLQINKCGLYLFQGESGVGKSTLLNLIAGFENADTGICDLEGASVAYSLQNQRMIEKMNTEANLCLYDTLYDKDTSERREAIVEALNLTHLLHHYPNELSRGQRQRLFIAQTLLSDCDILLFDEPTEYLDDNNRREVMRLLKQASKDKIVLITSHETDLLMKYDPICYSIKDQNVLLQKDTKEKKEAGLGKEVALNQKALSCYMESIIKLSRKRLFQQMLFLLIVLLLAFQLFSAMFLKEIKYYTYQSEVYIAQLDESSELSLAHISELELIPQFKSLAMKKDYVTPSIVPFYEWMRRTQNELSFIGEKEPSKERIIINQNFCKALEEEFHGNYLGKQITLGISIGDESVLIPFIIGGIVNEADALHLVQGYYDLEYVMEYLKEKEMYEDWKITCKTYMIRDNSIIPNLRKNYSDKSLYIGNKVEEAHYHEQDKLHNYRHGFQFGLLLLFILLIAYLLFLLHTYWNRVKGSLSILAMIVRNLPLMIKTHMRFIAFDSGKLIVISLSEIIIFILVMKLRQITLPVHCYVLMLLVPFAIVFIIYFAIWSAMHLLKTNRLSKILRLGDEEI